MLKKDRISELPDSLICDILTHLSTKKVVSTSVLSTRWRNIWLWVPNVELNSKTFPNVNAFVKFGDRFFDPIRVSCIQKLELTLNPKARTLDDDESYFTSWIEAAIKRKIHHLDVRLSKVSLRKKPLRLYSCDTLVYLRLYQVVLADAEFVSLPCLNTMYLDKNWYPREATLEKLISSCPVLKNLKIVASDLDTKVFRVHSRSLKTISIKRGRIVLPQYNNVPGVVIDAPLLRRLSIDDRKSESFVVKNLESHAKLDIYLSFGLGEMTISSFTFRLICRYSELEPLPQFCYMSDLCVAVHPTKLKQLETFLESCPNLKSLFLVQLGSYNYNPEVPSEEMNQEGLPSVPQCLLSSLQLVRFKVPITGVAGEMKLVNYFLKNSTVLKKLILRLDSRSAKDEILKELFEIPRGSTECELVIL
ncbi:unnamed protein product [Microthlaspi erraticum]|uniref:F-box domain-containing protein n=1 Tax=Microthlaspi erraticum TaxID=1685480 RepID=A0A6D2IQH5_9BRAS|nr:unnamed protein product [Microthlaspi erraticum]